ESCTEPEPRDGCAEVVGYSRERLRTIQDEPMDAALHRIEGARDVPNLIRAGLRDADFRTLPDGVRGSRQLPEGRDEGAHEQERDNRDAGRHHRGRDQRRLKMRSGAGKKWDPEVYVRAIGQMQRAANGLATVLLGIGK